MAAVFDSDEKALTGTTAIDIVPDPGASNQSQVLLLTAWNRDSAQRTITAQKTGGTINPMELASVKLESGTKGPIAIAGAVLENGQKIQVKSDAPAATTEPAVHASWFKIP